jgi:hypothetical protein
MEGSSNVVHGSIPQLRFRSPASDDSMTRYSNYSLRNCCSVRLLSSNFHLFHGDNIHSEPYIVPIFSYGVEGAGILLRHCMLNNQCPHDVNVEVVQSVFVNQGSILQLRCGLGMSNRFVAQVNFDCSVAWGSQLVEFKGYVYHLACIGSCDNC